MPRWEYQMFDHDMNAVELEAVGFDGWELVAVIMGVGVSTRFYFKRPLDEQGHRLT